MPIEEHGGACSVEMIRIRVEPRIIQGCREVDKPCAMVFSDRIEFSIEIRFVCQKVSKACRKGGLITVTSAPCFSAISIIPEKTARYRAPPESCSAMPE